jgi:hypothetical protein
VSGSGGATCGGGGGTSCTQGDPSDIPGVTASCSGPLVIKYSTPQNLPSSPYTFAFVFGGAWPGTRTSGVPIVFTLGKMNYVSIPFTPTTGGVQFVENNTNTPQATSYSISTQEGIFGTFDAFGNSTDTTGKVVCGHSGGNPSLASSPTKPVPTGTNCVLTAGTQYWFNFVDAQYNAGTSAWLMSCNTSTCQNAPSEYNFN